MESNPGSGVSETLRIALVLDSLAPPAWIARVIEELVGNIAVKAFLVPLGRTSNTEEVYLFRRYLDWDKARTHVQPDALAPTEIDVSIPQLTFNELTTMNPRVDIVFWLSEFEPKPLTVPARLGTWYFDHGLAGSKSSSTAYFPELTCQHAVSSTSLLAVRPEAGASVKLAEAHTATEIGWSLAKQKTAPLWKAALLPGVAMKRVGATEEGSRASAQPEAKVTNATVLRFAARNVVRTLNRRIRYANKESHWFVSYRTNRADFVAERGHFTAQGFKTLPAPDGHFYADPFILRWQNRTFLFVEDYLYAQARGVLSVLELLADGSFTPAQQILNRPYHLSYPFVFEQNGEVFLIPESMASRRIELYRAVEMPHRWELVKFLQEDVEAVDTTLWVENGVFYFFTNLVSPGLTPNDVLSLFMSDSLTGNWHPHPANPVSLDVRAARGAGKLFRMGDKLVRPAQDCSVRYGYATQLNHVQVLTPDKFREEPLFRIEPDWTKDLIGTHTINSDDTVEVIDGQVYQVKYRRQGEES